MRTLISINKSTTASWDEKEGRREKGGGSGRVDALRIIKSIHLNITRLSRDPFRETISENQKHGGRDEQLAFKGKNNGVTAPQ